MSTSFYRNHKWDTPLTYAVKHKDFNTRMESRSGGIFTALSDRVLNEGGVVFGCVLDEEFKAVHIRAENINDRNRMRGSKYIQSEMKDVFSAVRTDLDAGKQVLFSGTSCQVAGLNAFLGKEYENLLTVDIVCHGVPSPMVWKDYLKWQEKKNDSKVVGVDFRNKRDFGWSANVESVSFENGKKINSRVFATLFYEHSILRPCCYRCPYKDTVHPGDISIADYWGVEKAAPGFSDNKGVSLVLLNDDKGKYAFDMVQDEIEIKKTNLEDSMQPSLKSPYREPESRSRFWSDYNHLNTDKIMKKYGGYGLMAKVRAKIRWIIYKR